MGEPVAEREPANEAEERVLKSISCRGVAEISDLPEHERQLRASFIEALIAACGPGSESLCCPLRIRGADIVGPIRAQPRSGSGAGMALLFRDCRFDSPVDFSGAEFMTLRFNNCSLPAFIGASLTTQADFDLSGSRLSGISEHDSDLAEVGDCSIYLNHARIGGRLLMSATGQSRFVAERSVQLDGSRIGGVAEFNGARLQSSTLPALSARSAVLGSNLELCLGHGHRCEVFGEICLVAAHITGDLDCGGTRVIHPQGRSLHCEDLVVESVFLNRDGEELFEASGRLNFLSATIGGSFFLANALLEPGPDSTGMLSLGDKVALNLRQVRISNGMIFNNIRALKPEAEATAGAASSAAVAGWFLLAGARMNTLIDNIGNGWPVHGYLDLDGAVYERVRHLDGGDLVTKRIEWLRRQYPSGRPGLDTFRPQPYEQLTRALRESGLSVEADAIAVEKIRMRLAARVDTVWQRLFPRLLMLISNYGYSTRRAVFSFLVFVVMGAVMYTVAVAGFDQPFHPFEQPPEPTTYVLPFGVGTKDVPLGCPGLDTPQYALDFALPFINLGQDTFCRFVPDGPARWLWLALHSLYGLLGAGLSAVVVLTLTGLLRRD